MITKTFTARIENGQLRYQEPLADLEGREVQVTLILNGTPATPTPAANEEQEPPDPEPPEWLDVEKDIYVKMPLKSEIIENAVVLEGGPLQPCIILPEELPDD